MTLGEFKQSLSNPAPPENLDDLLIALWHDGKNNWDKAHGIVQDIASSDASWIHAYLHRKEGDIGNASYWYNRAGRAVSQSSLNEEWEEIVRSLL